MTWTARIIVISALATAPWVATGARIAWANVGQPTSAVSNDELKSFEQTKVTARQAIAAAQAHSNGAAVVEVKFDANMGSPVYRVRTYAQSAIWDGVIDAHSGQVIGAGETTAEGELDDKEKSELAGAVRVPTASLLRAVETAEGRGAGRVISAEVEEIDGQTGYELIVVKDGSPRRLFYRSHYH